MARGKSLWPGVSCDPMVMPSRQVEQNPEMQRVVLAVLPMALEAPGEVLGGCPHVGELEDAKDFPDGASSILVKLENVEELKSAIRLLAEKPEWRKKAGLNALAISLGGIPSLTKSTPLSKDCGR